MFRKIPLLKLLALAQVLMLAREHFRRLDANERHRLAELVRGARGLSPAERAELMSLVGKLEPGAFAGGAASLLSPLRPRR